MVRIGPAVLALLVIGTVATVGVVADGTFVSMTAEPVPERPTTDDAFAVDVHFESASGGGETYAIESVRISAVTDGSTEHLATDQAAPPLAPDDSRTVRVEGVTLEEPGAHTLRVEATLVSNGTERVVETTIRVEVDGTHPAIGVDVEPAVAGAWRTLNLTVANRHNGTLRGITVGLDGEDVRVRPDERVASSLAPGAERTLGFEVTAPGLGRHDLTVSVSYSVDGEVQSLERTIPVNFSTPEAPTEARLTDVNVTTIQTGLRINGSVVNDGESPIEGVAVSLADVDGVSPTAPSPESFVGSIEQGSHGSFTVTTALAADRETIPLVITFRVDGVTYRTVQDVAYDGPTALQAVQVTDLSIRPSAGGVRINGSAAAVGTQDATGVRIEVLDREGITSVSPRSSAFLGGIRRGESAPFELTASLADDRNTIPLSVVYTVDGVTYNETTTITYDGPSGVPPLELTGVSATPGQGSIEIEGSAANIGSQPVQGVVVSVANAEGVEPTGPHPEYFVGTVGRSDFTSFTVTASLAGNRSTVPLTVTYSVDGITYNATRLVEVGGQPSGSQPPRSTRSSDGGLPIPLLLVAAVVIALGVVAYRRLG